MAVRVRFAPSPTGYLHVGGLRTALYNYLFAKHHGGKCILRIEDTDRTRFVEGAVENLIQSLRWAGIEFDESPETGGEYGPYTQSERFDMYRTYGMELLAKGHAYYAFDTAEELDAMRERQQKAGIAPRYDRTTMRNQYTLGEAETARLLAENEQRVIRLKVPLAGEIKFSDIVRGEIVVPARDVDDQILLKSDGFPTYHLANVVDDHFMQITHVIRGEEWLPSTPKHVLMYDAFGWERPAFAHLPLLLNPDKSKLSKRQGDVAVEDYRDKGYFKEALVNFVALLGWNPTADREIFSMAEMIETFRLEKVNKAGAVFDIQKLDWMNGEYLRMKPSAELADMLFAEAQEKNLTHDKTYLEHVITLVRERVHKANELLPFATYMFQQPTEFEEEYKAKFWTDEAKNVIPALIEKFSAVEQFDHATLNGIVKEYAKESGVKMGVFANVLRLMTTGKQVGAGVFETLEILGREQVLARCKYFIERFA